MHNDSTQDSVTELQGDLSKSQRTMNAQQQTINNLRQQLNGMGQGDEGYNDLRNQLTEAQNAYADAQASVAATQQRLNTASSKVNQTLTAPFAGYVTVDQSKQNAPVITLLLRYASNLSVKSRNMIIVNSSKCRSKGEGLGNEPDC